jgi:uncharacterized protein YbaP (TraB family)
MALAVFFCLHSCQAQPAPKLNTNKSGNTLLWEISGNGLKKPSYLFGTFHLMCIEDIHFSQNLQSALAYSSEVYFEMDLDDPSNTLGALMFMNMKDGKTLKDLYTPEEFSRLEKFFSDSLRTSLKTFQKMKPTMLTAFLYPKMLPCKKLSGVEQELVKSAAKEKKEIRGFETIAMQAAVFDSIPYELQAKTLMNTIDSINYYKVFFDSLVAVYKSQKIREIEAMFNDPKFGAQDGMELLLDKRNLDWVNQLKGILPKQNIFMAVGAGHLIGNKGLIELLRKEGFTLRAIEN